MAATPMTREQMMKWIDDVAVCCLAGMLANPNVHLVKPDDKLIGLAYSYANRLWAERNETWSV